MIIIKVIITNNIIIVLPSCCFLLSILNFVLKETSDFGDQLLATLSTQAGSET